LPGYFTFEDKIDLQEEDIMFAVGLSKTTNFQFENQDDLQYYAEWQVRVIKYFYEE
jgi:hypothetical protein